MIKASEAKDLVKIYKAQKLKKQTVIDWLEANVEPEIKTTASEGGAWIMITVPGDLYNLIKEILEELGYEVSHVHGCQFQISWEN